MLRWFGIYSVLYVDDEPALLEIGKQFLEACGDITVTKSLSAAEAIRLLEQEKFDAIISDYQMPVMDGIQFLGEVRAHFGPVPFILFTGRGREEIVIQALNCGADFYLQKGGEPIAQFVELAYKIRSAVSQKRSEELLRTSEERYREFFTVSRDSVFITSPEGKWIDFNDAMQEMFGYESREELSETPVQAVYANPEERTAFLALIERDGYVKEFPLRSRQKDGTVLDALVTAVAARNPDDSVKAYIGTIRDVTRLKQATEDARRSHEELAASYEQLTAIEEELRQTIDDLGTTERNLRESEEKHRTVFENTGTAMVLLEESMLISLANAEFEKLSGFSRNEIEGKKTWVEFVVPEDRDRMSAQHRLRRQNQEKAITRYEFRFVTGSGEIRAIYLTIAVIPGTKKSVASLLDITEGKRAHAQVAILTRLYAVLSATNNAIVHIHDKKELLSEICRIVVETGGFSMAWAGIVNGTTHLIEPVGSAGRIDGYLDTIAIATDETPRGRGPTGTAFRTGTYTVCNDIESDPKMAPWRKGALERGYRSLAAFPFARNTASAGVITFYAAEPGFFTDRIIRLLDEQSENISFALETLDHAEQRAAAEQDLKKSELRYRRLFETAKDGILILDAETGKIIDANPYILAVLGYPLGYFIGKRLWEIGFIGDRSIAEQAFVELKTKSYVRYEDIPLEKKDGGCMDVEFISNSYLVGDKKIIQCNIRNITDRKRAENALRESDERYRSLFTTIEEGFCIIRMIFDENNKPVDFRFIEVNPAFERQTGLSGAVGRRIRELAPDLEDYWFEIYGKIVLTGQPVHFENYAEHLHRWYYVYAFRFGPPEKRLVSVLFSDITDRKNAENSMKSFSENLEREVAERTADLSDSNEKLLTEIGIRIDAEKHLTQSVREKEALLREVHHRVKNNLQIIISLLNLQSRYMTDEKTLAAFRESRSRVKAMAMVHEKLSQSANLATIDLGTYLRFLGDNLLQFMGRRGKGITFTTDIHDIFVAIDTAIPLGLMINELISNALKYAFPDGRKGEISLAVRRHDRTLTVLFSDNGAGIPKNTDWRNSRSLGLRLVIMLVDHLDGTIELDRNSGTAFTIVVKEKE